MTGGGVPASIRNSPVPGHAQKLPVVLLHGIGGGKEQWSPQLDQLAEHGWRAVAWDMPGYGESAPLSAPCTFEALASAVIRLLDALAIERAILAGHSMGGMVALETCALHPDRVAGLVLACTSAAFGSKDGAWQRRFIDERLAPLDAGRGMSELAARQVPRMMTRHAAPEARERAIAIMSAVPEATYRLALECLVTFDRREALARIAVPALALAASDDVQAPPAIMEKMAQRIAGAEYELLTNCGHLANLEAPAAFGAAVVDFLDRRLLSPMDDHA